MFQRIVDYLFFYKGLTIQYLTSIEQAPRALLEVKPTVLASVPRLYERAYLRVMDNVRKEPARKQGIFNWAVELGERCSTSGELDVPLRYKLQYATATRLVFRKIQDRFGGRLRFAIAGGAALPREGRPLLHRGGDRSLRRLRPHRDLTGALRQPAGRGALRHGGQDHSRRRAPDRGRRRDPGQEPGPDARLLEPARGDRDSRSTPRAGFTPATSADFDADGFLRITDRKKDLIVTSGGKNIAPQPIEQLLTASGVLVAGDRDRRQLSVPHRAGGARDRGAAARAPAR